MDTSISKDQMLRMEESKQCAVAKRKLVEFTALENSCRTNQLTLSSCKSISKVNNYANDVNCSNNKMIKTPMSVVAKSSEVSFYNHDNVRHLNLKNKTYQKGNSEKNKYLKHSVGMKQFYGSSSQNNALVGYCILISKHRFEVRIGFSQIVVDIFKSIASKCYGNYFFPYANFRKTFYLFVVPCEMTA